MLNLRNGHVGLSNLRVKDNWTLRYSTCYRLDIGRAAISESWLPTAKQNRPISAPYTICRDMGHCWHNIWLHDYLVSLKDYFLAQSVKMSGAGGGTMGRGGLFVGPKSMGVCMIAKRQDPNKSQV